MNIWACKIGGFTGELAMGADLPMRLAIERAYFELTGERALFNFSGWGGQLTDSEEAVVSQRLP